MQRQLYFMANRYARQSHRRHNWGKFVRLLACIVVFCTTYALILPAITMERVVCEIEEHTHVETCYQKAVQEPEVSIVCSYESLGVHAHTESCYGETGDLQCAMADYLVHTHDDSCKDATGALLCGLPEIAEHIHGETCYEILPPVTEENHIHEDSCYILTRGALTCLREETEGHRHAEACFVRGELICQKAEEAGHIHGEGCSENVLTCTMTVEAHIHGDGCYRQLVCELVEDENHTHTAECSGKVLECDLTEQPHIHTDVCYENHVLCQTPETEGHSHDNSCYEAVQICEREEEEAHFHEDGCYEQIPVLNCIPEPEKVLVCTEPVAQKHIHNESCFVTEVVPEETLTCTLPEDETHTHSDRCYGMWELICGKQEHAHGVVCLNDPDADVETAADWEASIANVILTGDYRQDILAIATTQLGYRESTRNYQVLEDGETVKGYTRYGAWYGIPYGDWCAMFASFCVHYAQVEDMPINASCRSWIDTLTELELYHPAEGYTPQSGDLIFFDWKGDTIADHVGIVVDVIPATEEEPAKVKTIEGNTFSDNVGYCEYLLDDADILGYSELPENKEVHYCGLNEHIHGESCCNEAAELTCGKEEHTHSFECTLPRELDEEARREIIEVFLLIDALPSYDEIVAKLDEFYEADDAEGEEAYMMELYAQVETAYRAYMGVEEDLRVYLTNLDKLMELEFIWSQITLEEEVYNYSPLPHASENTRVYLFDYGHLINDKITGEGMGLLPFYRLFPEYSYTVDGEAAWDHDTPGTYYGKLDTKPPVISNRLVDGYPYIESGNQSKNGSWLVQWGSLRYLFDPEYIAGNYWSKGYWATEVRKNAAFTNPYTADAVNPTGLAPHFRRAYLPVKNDGSGTGLFQRDPTDGYLYYDSGKNAAWYNPATEKFELYNYTLIPGHEAFEIYGGTTNGNFLPFNKGHVEGRTDYQTAEGKVQDKQGKVLWTNRVTANIGDMVGKTGSRYPLLRENFRLITSNRTNAVNLNFGMVVEFDFYMPKGGQINGKDMEFVFKGDDDVWVFIDDVLVLDIGGCHGAESATINFRTGQLTQPGASVGYHKPNSLRNAFNNVGITTGFNGNTFADYTTHTLKFFYMERGGNVSFCRLRFNMPQLNENSVSVVKELTANADVEMVGDPYFSFQIMKADSKGNRTTTPFFGDGAAGAGKPYNVYDANTNELLRTSVTEDYGIFKIKAGERAEFSGITENSGKYYIREILDNDFYAQYEHIYVDGKVVTQVDNVWNQYKGPVSPVKDFSDGTSIFSYSNRVDAKKLSYLTITKMVEGVSDAVEKTLEFDMKVELNGTLNSNEGWTPIPVGTPYTLYRTDVFMSNGQKVKIDDRPDRVVTTEGIITVPGGATAEIDYMLPGTTYRVHETDESAEGYSVTYGAFWGGDWIKAYSDRVEGTIPVYNESNLATAHVCMTVTNKLATTLLQIPVTKTLANGSADPNTTHTYSFTIDLVKINNYDPSHYNTSYSETQEVQVTGGNPANFNFVINYSANDFWGATTLVYEIRENVPDEVESTHDPTVFTATVAVVPSGSKLTASLQSLTKNGQAVSSVNFVNTLLGDLTLEKVVNGGTIPQENGRFNFTVQLGTNATTALQNWNVQMIRNDQSAGTVNTGTNGIINLPDIKHGDKVELKGIPLGTVWRITETNADGYIVNWTKTGGSGTSNIAEGSISAGGMDVVFTNTASYELPETGGTGTTSYTMAGLVLIIFGMVYLMYRIKARRREDF